jgi:hypothetical protein
MPLSRHLIRRSVRLLAASLLLGAASACSHYPQDTPEAVVAAAKEMVKTGHADHLPDLIYAENKDMRALLSKLGEVMGSLQDLGLAVQKQFPEEISELRAQAEEAAKKGEASNFLQKMTGQMMGGGRRNRRNPIDPQQGDQMRSTMDLLMKEVFADPYGWLAESEGRLTVTRANMPDDMAALQWDAKPVLGVGLTMKQDGGKWYVQLPIPQSVMPKSADTWEILGAGLDVVDHMLIDLKKDVTSGRITHLEQLASQAGEKAFLPAALCVLAFEKVRQSERKEQKAAAAAASIGPPK